jgi:rubrerythrin
LLLVFIYQLFMPEIKTFYFVEYSGQGTELEIVPFDIKLTPAGGKFVASPSRRKAPGWRVLFTKGDLNRFADSEERAARQYLSQCLHKALIKENELRAAQNNVADAQGLVAKFEIKKMNPTHWSNLDHRDDRTVARIARIAISDTIHGGCRALRLSKRLAAVGGQDVQYVVSDVYSASSGYSHPEHSAWECPECGSAHLGQEAARRCCDENEEKL